MVADACLLSSEIGNVDFDISETQERNHYQSQQHHCMNQHQ